MDNTKTNIRKKEISIPFKKAKIKKNNKNKKNKNNNKLFNIKNIFIPSTIFLLIIIIITQFIIILYLKKNKYNYFQQNSNYNQKINEINTNSQKYDISFKYENYDKEIITERIKRNSGWIIGLDEAQFINGIIRKNKLKNCLEIGVAHGGSSILILNSIKDIENSILVSLDLNSKLYNDPNKATGYRVNQYFPELINKWKLPYIWKKLIPFFE